MTLEHADHFESLERQARAARFGMWVFLASEVLLFSGLFALYAGQRAQHPEGFALGVHHADVLIGTVNTAVLLVSSWAVAQAARLADHERLRPAGALLAVAAALGAAFLGLKGVEYARHVAEGALPGGRGALFETYPSEGLAAYFNLYWVATGLHALHVAVGVLLIAWLASAALLGRLGRRRAHRVEVVGLYWHLVDAVWIVLWPLFYLMGGE